MHLNTAEYANVLSFTENVLSFSTLVSVGVLTKKNKKIDINGFL
jgi:hypothetical protein